MRLKDITIRVQSKKREVDVTFPSEFTMQERNQITSAVFETLQALDQNEGARNIAKKTATKGNATGNVAKKTAKEGSQHPMAQLNKVINQRLRRNVRWDIVYETDAENLTVARVTWNATMCNELGLPTHSSEGGATFQSVPQTNETSARKDLAATILKELREDV